MIVDWNDNHLALLPERAAVWIDGGALVVADVHLGKADSFRAAGVPVPAGVTETTLARLDAALRRAAVLAPVERVIVLGDLLHAIVTRWPELHEHLLNPDGSLSKRANLFVDGRALRFLPAGLETPLTEEQEIDCFQAVAGG